MNERPRTPPPELPILTLPIRNEVDTVLVRQRARVVSELLGFGLVDQTRVATAVSEIARNALHHGGRGLARFRLAGSPQAFEMLVEDRGSGASPRPLGPSERGGAGLELARRLMDGFEVEASDSGGWTIRMSKVLPGPSPRGASEVQAIVDELLRSPPESLLEELYQQHQELLAVLENLTRKQEALSVANAELEETNRGVMALHAEVTRELDDTNRGVMALYAQLDDQAAELQRVNALKDRFLWHLSHEFRTPLNSTIALSRVLLDHVDGPLNEEQEVQIRFINEGAEELLEMINDLLDLAKIEAGRMEVRPESFELDDLVGPLRGMFRPVAAEAGLDLVFEPPRMDFPTLYTDRGKLAQILRNLLSNAVKFTESGEVRFAAELEGDDRIAFRVTDTGIGIAPEDLEHVFDRFVQVERGRAASKPGTGLGLPLARDLATLLGGSIDVESEVGRGSTFTLSIPSRFDAAEGTSGPIATS